MDSKVKESMFGIVAIHKNIYATESLRLTSHTSLRMATQPFSVMALRGIFPALNSIPTARQVSNSTFSARKRAKAKSGLAV